MTSSGETDGPGQANGKTKEKKTKETQKKVTGGEFVRGRGKKADISSRSDATRRGKGADELQQRATSVASGADANPQWKTKPRSAENARGAAVEEELAPVFIFPKSQNGGRRLR